ncbi:hypothetical protein TSTA_033060 [Talaromyces stipitatus ATCC 10500]|uniref:BZIP domain-containing protein n=1 Tax=Talaromyces stipitatus (strain ATCC 10500 / CBS 375.48 / QM 6759 / NRRL 1006) TaxID=441959 RepID=B8M5T0_TALSN|nr:uncharacterized protein TSTA_033060 [Talaromyces stipitatus ATCC 10500]EED20057.1 hypothetical protein TSTA_033060 [Talaromyces stipitatus ATCC 10500]
MTSHSTVPSPTSRNNMGPIDLPLNYDMSRFYMNFQSPPPVSAAMLRQGQATPPMSDLGDSTEDDFGLDCTFYSPPVSATMSSQGQLTPPMSISDLDGYTEHDFTTFDCTLPAGMTPSNGKFYLQEKRRMQNREAQRRFRARNQKHIKGLQKELNDLRAENTKFLEENNKKDEEISRLQKKIKEMNRETKDSIESMETDTKMDSDMPARCQCWTRNGTLARFRPTDLVCRKTSMPGSPDSTGKEDDCRSGYGIVMELVPADRRHSEHTYESFRKRLEAKAGDESEETPETTDNDRMTANEPEGEYFLLSPLTVH